MQIPYENPDDFVTVITQHTCSHHKQHPHDNWPGCTCGFGYGRRRATPEERAHNIHARLKEENLRRLYKTNQYATI